MSRSAATPWAATSPRSSPQEMKRAGEPQPVLQLLIYPALDVASDSPSMTTYGNAYPLSRATMEWFMGHYMGPEDSPTNPLLSPGREGDLTNLAPAVIATAGFDPLLDQGEDYAQTSASSRRADGLSVLRSPRACVHRLRRRRAGRRGRLPRDRHPDARRLCRSPAPDDARALVVDRTGSRLRRLRASAKSRRPHAGARRSPACECAPRRSTFPTCS